MDLRARTHVLEASLCHRWGMRIAILAYGSRGDIQPMVALAAKLRERGHSVVMTANEDLADWASRSGVRVVPTQPNVEAFLKSNEARVFLAKGRITAFGRRIAALERGANSSLTTACIAAAEGADLVLSTVLTAYRGAAVGDAMGIEHRPVLTQPVRPTGEWASMLSPVPDLRAAALNRLSGKVFHGVWWRQNRSNIDEMCDTLGIARYQRRPEVEALPSIELYSPTVTGRPRDWSPHHELVGWCSLTRALREQLGEASPPEGLTEWIDAGPAPVFFGFGSMPVLDPARTLRELASVTAARGLRGLIGAGWSDYVGAGVPDHLFIAPAFDHDRVLPRCRAAVHHGGSGTTAAVLRAGLPSVVAHVFADQPYWGWRLEQLGVGVSMPFRKLDAGRLGRALDVVLDDGYGERSRHIGGQVRAEVGALGAADVIERRTATAIPA
jgi:sterol 3beta-glucosyltransferase